MNNDWIYIMMGYLMFAGIITIGRMIRVTMGGL